MRLLRLIGKARKGRSSRAAVRWLFLRALGAVYLIAFTSLRVQVLGLYGSRGIQPIRELLAALRAQAGRSAYRLAPSLLWLGASDRDLVGSAGRDRSARSRCWSVWRPAHERAALGAVPLVRLRRRATSFHSSGTCCCSRTACTRRRRSAVRARLARGAAAAGSALLMRWLAFRLHFESGLAKLRIAGSDLADASQPARYHYETQPLPTRLGWYAHQLPRPVHRGFDRGGARHRARRAVPRIRAAARARRSAFALLTGLQALIAATGNYAFFNVLTVALDRLGCSTTTAFPPRRLRPRRRAPARRRRGALARASRRYLLARSSRARRCAAVTFAAQLRHPRCRSRLGPDRRHRRRSTRSTRTACSR